MECALSLFVCVRQKRVLYLHAISTKFFFTLGDSSLFVVATLRERFYFSFAPAAAKFPDHPPPPLFRFSFSLSVNALTADGTKHARMDETTAQGRDPREASEIFVALLNVWSACLFTAVVCPDLSRVYTCTTSERCRLKLSQAQKQTLGHVNVLPRLGFVRSLST